MVKSYKILVIGEGAVGKTSIATRYTTGSFKESHIMTIGANFMLKDFKTDSGQNIRLSIWDTAGQENFRNIVDDYYKDAKGALVVFSITSQQSFDELDFWIETTTSKTRGIDLILVGNKADLEKDRVISYTEGVTKAEQLGVSYFETSAKTNQNVKEVFAEIIENILIAE